MKTNYETANIERFIKICEFARLHGLNYETEYRDNYFKKYVVTFSIPAVLVPAYNSFINANKLF